MTTRRPLSTTTMTQRDIVRVRQTVVVLQNSLTANCDCSINIVSFNMHGFNQGCHTVSAISAEIFLLQEHWLTPTNLYKFETCFNDCVCFRLSAMNSAVESGVLYGRPYGGVMTLVTKKLQKCTKVFYATKGCVVVSVGNLIVFNVYLPCSGTDDRIYLCEEIVNDILEWISKYPDHVVIVGGDLNSNLDETNPVFNLINQFVADAGLLRCDNSSGAMTVNRECIITYLNESIGCGITIEYFSVSDSTYVSSYDVLDPD